MAEGTTKGLESMWFGGVVIPSPGTLENLFDPVKDIGDRGPDMSKPRRARQFQIQEDNGIRPNELIPFRKQQVVKSGRTTLIFAGYSKSGATAHDATAIVERIQGMKENPSVGKERLYQEIARYSMEMRRTLMREVPGLDPNEVDTGFGAGMDQPLKMGDVRRGSRLRCFLKAARYMREIYELHQYKMVFHLLQAMSPEARAAILHNLLMDQNLAGMMQSPSVMLRPLYATSQMNTVARLPTLIDTDPPKADNTVTMLRATIMGPVMGHGAVIQVPTNIFGRLLGPADNITTFDASVMVVQSNNVCVARIPEWQIRTIAAVRAQRAPGSMVLSNNVWLATRSQYQGNEETREGFIEKWFAAPDKGWGDPSRMIVDVTQPLQFQIVEGDKLFVRLQVQDVPYDVFNTTDVPGRSMLLQPELHARMFVTAGKFDETQFIDEGPGVITGIKRVNFRAVDARLTGTDCPTDVYCWIVTICGGQGRQEIVKVFPNQMVPQRNTFNSDTAGRGVLVYLYYQPGRYTEQKDPGGRPEILKPTCVKCLLGPNAWAKCQAWAVLSWGNVACIPVCWRPMRPNFTDLDFLLRMYSRVHGLFSLMGLRAMEDKLAGVHLDVTATITQRYPAFQFKFFVPLIQYCSNKRAHGSISKCSFYQLMPISASLLYFNQFEEDGGKYQVNENVTEFSATVVKIKKGYVERVHVEDPFSAFWQYGKLDAVSLDLISENLSAADMVYVGNIISCGIPTQQALNLIASVRTVIHMCVRISPLMNEWMRRKVAEAVSENSLLRVMHRVENYLVKIQADRKDRSEGVVAIEDSPKNAIVATLMGLTVPNPVQERLVAPIPRSIEVFQFQTPTGKMEVFTPHQSWWIAEAVAMDDKGNAKQPVMVLTGSPGAGKTQMLVTTGKMIIDQNGTDNGEITSKVITKEGQRIGQEVVCITTPTRTSTYALCDKVEVIFRSGLTQQNAILGEGATRWTHPRYRPILIGPKNDMAVKVTHETARRMSLQYFMYDDEKVPKKVLEAREACRREWEKFYEISIQIDERPLVINTGEVLKQQQELGKNAAKLQDDLCNTVLECGKFNWIIMTCRQGEVHVANDRYDLGITVLMIDEAPYSTDISTVILSRLLSNVAPRQLILCGDTQQLRSVPKAKGMVGMVHAIDTISRLMNPGSIWAKLMSFRTKESIEDQIKMPEYDRWQNLGIYVLPETFRQTEAMNQFTSFMFYGGRVQTGLAVETQIEKDYQLWRLPFSIEGFSFMYFGVRGLETCTVGNSRCNMTQIQQVVSLADLAINVLEAVKTQQLAIVTPYTGTVVVLEDELRKIWPCEDNRPAVLTTDASQGREFSLVIFVTIRCQEPEKVREIQQQFRLEPEREDMTEEERFYPAYDHDKIPHSLKLKFIGFMQSFNRINVATSRHQNGLIIVGDPFTMDMCLPMYVLSRYAMANGCYLENGIASWVRYAKFSRDLWYETESGWLRPLRDVVQVAKDEGYPEVVLPGFGPEAVSQKLEWPPSWMMPQIKMPKKIHVRVSDAIVSLKELFPKREMSINRTIPFTPLDKEAAQEFRYNFARTGVVDYTSSPWDQNVQADTEEEKIGEEMEWDNKGDGDLDIMDEDEM